LIRNVIFDIGNVLLTFKPKKFLLKFTKDIKGIDFFISNIINSQIWLEMDQGLLSIIEAKNLFLIKFPELRDIINIFFINWLDIFNPIEKNIKILKDLKSNKYKVYDYFLSSKTY
jgi:FMN phosphatase YigB (HAD superfamily)